MPRGISTKFDETFFEKPNYYTKFFMYNSSNWDILYPIVNLIRLFPKPTIITHCYRKNQTDIKLYGKQYGHLVIGNDFKVKEDYIKNLKSVKFVFVFSDTSDPFADNIIKYCKTSKTPIICYSSIDNLYHFYTDGDTKKVTLITPEEVIKKIEDVKEMSILTKIDELFPEFDILETDKEEKPVLENCIKILREKTSEENGKKVFTAKIPFDANFNKLKKLENNKKKNEVVYDDELPSSKPKSTKKLLSEFFKKN
jgi:hypothetical protein